MNIIDRDRLQIRGKTVTKLRDEFREKLKLAHNALDVFAESRLTDTDTFTQMKDARAAVEAVLRFERHGNCSDPCIDKSRVPTVEFVIPLSAESKWGRHYWEAMAREGQNGKTVQ